MELITKELEQELAKHPLYSNEDKPLIEQEIKVERILLVIMEIFQPLN